MSFKRALQDIAHNDGDWAGDRARQALAAARKSDDMTRVLSTAGEVVATYGHEFYPGHVAAIVYELNPHLTVQSTEDGGKTWTTVTERTVP